MYRITALIVLFTATVFAAGTRVTVVHTNNTNGVLENCL
jgi:hypothetical protein